MAGFSLKTANEPVMIVTGVLATLGWLADFLVAHGVITSSSASTLVQGIAPSVIAAVTLAAGFLIRHYVSPFWKLVQAEAGKFESDSAAYGGGQAKPLAESTEALTGAAEAAAALAELGLSDYDVVAEHLDEPALPPPSTRDLSALGAGGMLTGPPPTEVAPAEPPAATPSALRPLPTPTEPPAVPPGIAP